MSPKKSLRKTNKLSASATRSWWVSQLVWQSTVYSFLVNFRHRLKSRNEIEIWWYMQQRRCSRSDPPCCFGVRGRGGLPRFSPSRPEGRLAPYTGKYFWGGRLPVFMLIGWRAANDLFARGWSTVGQMTWCKWRRTKCGRVKWASLGLFVRTLISLTNAYAGCGRPTLNCIGRFWLESVRSASKLNSKCTQMNYEMNCITMHKCTEMYCNVLQTARVHSGECQSCFFFH